jgi:hypothetical protein
MKNDFGMEENMGAEGDPGVVSGASIIANSLKTSETERFL